MTTTTVDSTEFNGCQVLTVFLGVDCNRIKGNPPLLFETTVSNSGTPLDRFGWRSSTWVQAQAKHDQMVSTVRTFMKMERFKKEGDAR